MPQQHLHHRPSPSPLAHAPASAPPVVLSKRLATIPPMGAKFEMVKDGKMKLLDAEGKATGVEGTYTLEGDKFTVVIKQGEKEMKNVVTVKKLTDS